MARSFAITTPVTETLRADAQGHAEAVFTATNATSRPIRGMAKVKALGDTKREWLDIEGESERDFAPGATQQFTVTFDAKPDPSASTADTGAGTGAASRAGGTPTASGIKPGRYSFRLDAASAMSPDEDFAEGPVVTVEVAQVAAPVKKAFPIWIIPVIAVVLIAIGITLWLLLRTKKVEVPGVVGKTVAEATSEIERSKLKANVSETKVVTGTVDAGKVSGQKPEAGAKVAEGSMVALVVEAEKPTPSPVPTHTPSPVPTQRINVAVGKTATQSSTYPNGQASRAVDGNTDGNWSDFSVSHTQSVANAWWQVDLGREYSIAQIKTWNRTDCCPERLSNFYVFVSSSPFTSTDINTTLNQPGVYAFPAPGQAGSPTTITVGKTGRFVRVQLVGTNYLSLAEVEVIAEVPANQ